VIVLFIVGCLSVGVAAHLGFGGYLVVVNFVTNLVGDIDEVRDEAHDEVVQTSNPILGTSLVNTLASAPPPGHSADSRVHVVFYWAGAARRAMVRAMDAKMRWISQLAERTLVLEYQCGGVTRVGPGHTTGWRTLPGTLTAFTTGYESLLLRPGQPDLHVHSGQVLCVPQGERHQIDIASRRGGVSRWSHIAFRLLGGIDVFSLLVPPAVLTGAPARRIGTINEELAALHAPGEAPLHRVARRQSLAMELLAILAEHSGVREDRLPAADALPRLGGVLELMAKDLAHPPDIDQMARACSLSTSRFHATFRSVMGVSPGRYLQDLRLLRAKHLLLAADLPVKAVADETGFGDVFLFSRLFRKRCGSSPSAYRAQVRRGLM
jgi:AraC family transcriptional regulator, arabinose operon regulatory protein